MSVLKTIYKYWLIFAKKLSIIPTTLILFIIYFCCIGAISIVNLIFGKDLLDKRLVDGVTYWREKEYIPADLGRCKRLF